MLTITCTRIANRKGQLAHESNMDHWRVTLNRLEEHGKSKARMTVEYSCGKGWKGQAPTLADVLCSLRSDASVPESFDDFCAEMGYDTDSRKAESTWKACRSIAIRMRKLLGPSGVYLLRDGEPVQAGHPNMLVGWMHRNHSYSWTHAMQHEGYSIEGVA